MPFPVGKHYTAEEFFTLHPEENNSERYELMNGEIIALAAPTLEHQRIVGGIYRRIGNFIDSRKGKCEPFISPADVVLDNSNVVQPDVFVVCDKDKLDGRRCNGAPDFVAEVTSSNRSTDFTRKLALYAESGVREYWIVDLSYKRVIVYFFEESNSPNIYTFDADIPVRIYKGDLTIKIDDII